MTRLAAAAFALSLVLAPAAFAQEEAPKEKKVTAQQQRMKDCNAEAKEKALKGDDRKAFMKTCLSGGKAAPLNPQQAKMKDCNAQAKEQKLKGKERKEFVANCLKSS